MGMAVLGILLFICVVLLLISRVSLKKLKDSAYIDSVTGGLTEAGLQIKGQEILSGKSRMITVVSMQATDLKQICKTFGVKERDRTLRHLYGVLKAQLGSDELIARTGEDTFCFLLKSRSPEKIRAKLDNICDAANRFNEGSATYYYLKLIFGIYLPETEGEALSSLLSKAALSRLGCSEDGRYHFYDREQYEKAERERALADSMSRAQQIGEFVVYFQPKVRISDQRVVGAEALIRWRHAQQGLLSPDMFLPLAEQYRKIEQLDRFVFEQVCQTLARWEKQGRELCPISVNLSRADISRPDLPDECNDICRRYGVSPSQIEFEMKEALLLENLRSAKILIEKFHAHGFRCALDNFGANSCSLQLLGSMDIDTIKLDRSFFYGENNSRHGRYIVETILKLAAQLQISTVAEGVDNQGQAQYLQQVACDTIQGFYYFKPMPLERFESEAYEDKALKYVVATSSAGQVAKRDTTPKPIRSSKSIVLFSYYPQDDSVEFSDVFSPALGNQTHFEKALALFRTTHFIHENDRDDFFRLLERCQRERGWVENTLRFYMADGRYEWLELRMRQDDHSTGGTISGVLVNMSDWKNEVNRWKEKATRDVLTGLYNREYFEQNVNALLKRGTLTSAAILFIDVDDFKRVNDTYGHIFGDGVLCFMAKQIPNVFRHSDLVARYGGDEFVVFAPSIESDVLLERMKRLCGVFQHPYRNDSVDYKISGSIGAAMYPRDGLDYETLLDHADCALYEAKNRGKNQYVMYEPHMQGNKGGDDHAAVPGTN